MVFAELAAVRHRVSLGAPLPFNVRDADRTLLLARGQSVASADALEALFERGALVDLSELQSPRDEILKARRDELPRLWGGAVDRLGEVLEAPDDPAFAQHLDDAGTTVRTLVERDPDLAIFQVLQQGADVDTRYGAQRSMQTAITALLVAQRLSWTPEQAGRAFRVALTMHLSMLSLQGELARQAGAPSAAQRAAIASHPERSAALLERAGIADPSWIEAVRHHHEVEDGAGALSTGDGVGELAELVRRADIYTAKLARRAARAPIMADAASRQMFMQEPGHSVTAALVKEFGIYPPGSHVRLATGEIGVVVERAAMITTPIVAVLADDRGQRLARPLRRDTSVKAYAVTAVIERPPLAGLPSLQEILQQWTG